jgi:catechol 2,3-dioxygenase-like lactoylglutathione lyase family enzyme
VLIRHLALTVRDPRTSVAFYLSTLGLEGDAREAPWGYRVDLRDGFMLALIRGEPLPTNLAGTVHFGCSLASREEALEMRARLQDAGVREVVWEDSEGYAGVKVRDPDDYVVELAYDVT